MTEKNEERLDAMELSILVILWIAMLPICILMRGVLIHSCWQWFIIPLGAIEVGYVHSYGIAITAQIMGSNPSSPSASKTFGAKVMALLLFPVAMLLVWGIAFVIHLWM